MKNYDETALLLYVKNSLKQQANAYIRECGMGDDFATVP